MLWVAQEEPVHLERVLRAAYPVEKGEDGRLWYRSASGRNVVYDEASVEDGYYRTVELEFGWDDPADREILASDWVNAAGERLGGTRSTRESAGFRTSVYVVQLNARDAVSVVSGRVWLGPRKLAGEPKRVEVETPLNAPLNVDHAGASIEILGARYRVHDDGSTDLELEATVPADRSHEFVFTPSNGAIVKGSRGMGSWKEDDRFVMKMNFPTKLRVEPVETEIAVGFVGTCMLDVGGTAVDIQSVAWSDDGRRLVVRAFLAAPSDDIGLTVEGLTAKSIGSSMKGGRSEAKYEFESVRADKKSAKIRLIRKVFEPGPDERKVTVDVYHRDVQVVEFDRIPVP